MAIYQRSQPDDRKPDLVLDDPVQSRSIKELPQSITELMDCPKPASKPQCTAYPSFKLLNDAEIPSSVKRPDAVWLLGCTLMRPSANCRETSTEPTNPHISYTLEPEQQPGNFLSIPTWSGYHSLISHTMPVTRVGTPPLIAAPAHEWETYTNSIDASSKDQYESCWSSKKDCGVTRHGPLQTRKTVTDGT